ncbi:20312_t:CDS:2, partial [Funneliformis geosporum]
MSEPPPTAASLTTEQQIVQQLNLKHGLFLDGHSIRSSKEAIFADGNLKIRFYKGEPIVYTNVNDPKSHINLLSFNNDIVVNLSEVSHLQPSDACINFPIAEFSYKGELLKTFSKCTDDDDESSYGHFFARKVLVGGKLFIKNLKSASPIQNDIVRSLLTWIYNSAKYKSENPLNDVYEWDFFPEIETSNGLELKNPKDLTTWMQNLYQKNMFDIISYNDIVPVSQLRISIDVSETSKEKQPGIYNYENKLSFKEWVGDALYVNLTRWVKDFHLLQGLIFNKHFEIEISKEISINFNKIPEIKSLNKCHIKMIKPTTDLKEFLLSNNISISLDTDMNSSPFINKNIKSDNFNNKDYIHFVVKYEQYEILLPMACINPSANLKQYIENSLNSVEPFKALQDTFDKFGHLFSQRIVLGKSLKNILPDILPDISFNSENIDLGSLTFDFLNSRLNVSYLLTQGGDIIDNDNELSSWIRDIHTNLEIIELDQTISLNKILGAERQKEIDNLFNKDIDKIIMTGISDLKDLDSNNIEHYKRINIEPILNDKDYKVFGSIVSGDKKIDDYFIKFGFYDANGFSAMIKTLRESKINVRDCSVLWMIVGNPMKLSVFSPNHREIQVDRIKKSITYQQDESIYGVKTHIPLSHGYSILVDAFHSSTTYDIKLSEWSNDQIKFQIKESTYNNKTTLKSSNSDIISDSDSDSQYGEDNETTIIDTDLDICILRSSNGSLKIDHVKIEYPLDLFGHTLTKDNLAVLDDPDSRSKFKTFRGLLMKCANEIVAPFIPLVTTITTVTKDIADAYENVQYNKKTCGALVTRVEAVEVTIRGLIRQRDDNLNKFCSQSYYNTFSKLTNCLKQIKEFSSDISQLSKFKKFVSIGIIKESFEKIIKDFDNYSNFLNLKLAITNEQLSSILNSDLIEMMKFLDKIEGGITYMMNHPTDLHVQNNKKIAVKVNNIGGEYKACKDKHEFTPINGEIDTIRYLNETNQCSKSEVDINGQTELNGQIEPSELKDTAEPDSRKGINVRVLKKIYKEKYVACKYFSTDKINQRHLAILRKLKACPYIIQFFGLSRLDTSDVMVFEWAEYGTLCELYQNYIIGWDAKISFARDICRGLIFLHTVEILHHDIRCENVLITEKMQPKLCNFKFSREFNAATSQIEDMNAIVHWLAPEKLENISGTKDKACSYTIQCDIFSFVMLLWELGFQKKPYENMNITEIQKHVQKGDRETFDSISRPIQTEYCEIIKLGWVQEPSLRPGIQQIFNMLQELYEKHILKNSDEDKPNFSIPVHDSIIPIIPFKEGLVAHKKKNYEMAWKCFEEHANVGDMLGKYWQGYYYLEGRYVEKNLEKAKELFKESADGGNADAQLRYAFCLIDKENEYIDTLTFLKYLEMSANNENSTALYNLGEIYLNGRLNIEKDHDKGIQYLKLAALKGQLKAKEVLKNYNISL